MKRISLILILALVLTLCAACSARPAKAEETILYDDGSYLVVTTVVSNRMTTDVIEDPAEMMPQSNQSQEGYSINLLSHRSSSHDAKHAVRTRGMIATTNQYSSDGWLIKDGKRIWVGFDRSGNLLYHSEIATKYCSYYSADHRLLWTMSLTGIFRENSTDRHCDVLSTSIDVYEQDSWYVIAEAEDKGVDTVYYTVQFGRKNLGVTISQPSYTISLNRFEF